MRRLGRDDQHAWGIPSRRWVVLAVIFYLSNQLQPNDAVVLTPPNRNLAHGRKIEATFTCGEVNGQPISEMYCTIAGASPYTPHNQYSYRMMDGEGKYKEMMQKESFLRGASNMVDGSPAWYQSPPLSRGMQYREINITIDLEQEFHVAYVWIQMANSPRPGTWILEHSVDYGKTYQPWQYFASSPAECSRLFGIASLSPITEDDSVICTSEFSSIQPMDNGEIMLNLLENRPGKNNFGASKKLQTFAKATNVRIVLLKPKTLQGHLMDLHGDDTHHPHADATVTRRYFYGIKEVLMGGRCVCNGHADSCDVLDVSRPRTWLCRCEHNTCGDSCERCCSGFEQKKWMSNHEFEEFTCEPCNCHGHSQECVYEEKLDENHQSLDIHGNYSGGGRCLNCRDNTEGINCNQCKAGYYRPENKEWTDPDVCQACVCDPTKHTGNCAEETGKCECLPNSQDLSATNVLKATTTLQNADSASAMLMEPLGRVFVDGKCPCKEGYSGTYCESCSPGYTNLTAGCPACKCDDTGSVNAECDVSTGQCACKSNFGGLQCNKCANGYFNHPACDYCDCDPSGTEDDICDQTSGQCLCKAGFSGRRCEQCDENYFGYPNCKECGCNAIGSKSQKCDATNGECPCHPNFTSRTCDRCAAKYYRYPECLECGCNSAGSKGVTCDNDGQCYCKPNFEGNHCDQCKEKFYNFPICEECNCHPSGVIPEFAGCDKVAPGELCTCRENVIGRTCSQCKPTFWDLQPYHEKGCVDCNCNKTGTLSLLNSCDQVSGQCTCKRYVAGQKCDLCADGFYNMQANSQVGCQACNCDAGGAIGNSCNQNTGQCRCRPRIQGLKCDQPIQDHFFQLFGTIDTKQRKVVNQMESLSDSPLIQKSFRTFPGKSAVYKLLFHYKNPTEVSVEVDISLMPFETKTPDFEQKIKAVLEPTAEPTSKFINTDEQPLVLNVGKWHMKIKSPKRLFLDYVVLVPSEYYLGSSLSERIQSPCSTNSPSNESCVELLYPPMPSISKPVHSSAFPFVKNLKLDSEYINLSKAKATKGVQSSCLNKEVRVISLISERYHAQFTSLNVDKQIELFLRFRTTQPSAHLATVMTADVIWIRELVKIDIESDFLVVRSNREDSELIKTELSTRMAGHWHYVSVVRNKNTLKMHLDDVFSEEVKAGDVSDVINSNDVVLIFGHSSSSETPGNFIGCIEHLNEVKLTGCTIGGVPITSTTGEGKGHSPDDPESAFKAGNGASTAAGTGLLPAPLFLPLPMFAGGKLRATAANGIIMFVTNEKHSDYMALYMQDGKIFFSFGSGTAQLTIQGKQSLLDDEWHSVRAEREGTVAALFIDGRPEAENQTEGTELIDAQPPLYIGGLPTDLVPFASRILPVRHAESVTDQNPHKIFWLCPHSEHRQEDSKTLFSTHFHQCRLIGDDPVWLG
uniref:Uncharacterized protein n=1 Tax=Ditylenchus dipsaci TaxID=166011 RepID=A0A915EV46_9BILA